MITIKTYNGTEADFYIQAKGLNAGRPLRQPIANCFSVNTNIQNAYEIIYCLWTAKAFYSNIIGTCIPFIRISDVKKIILPVVAAHERINQNNLVKIKAIDEEINKTEQRIKLLKEMKKVLANQTIKENGE